MERIVSNISSIQVKATNWTALVQVVDKTKELTSFKSATQAKYKRLLLTDSEGTKCVAIIYGNDIEYFRDKLYPYRRYFISNAVVRQSKDVDASAHYQCSWLITNNSVVEEYPEAIPPTFACDFNFTKFGDLFRYADTDTLQDVVGVVVAALPPKKKKQSASKCRDFVIVNDEEKPIILSLWNDFETEEGNQILTLLPTSPIIMGLKIKVSSFHGLSISSWLSATISVNPPLKNQNEIKQWFAAKRESLILKVRNEEHKNLEILLPPPSEEDVVLIVKGEHLRKNFARAIWVKAKATVLPGQNKYWYRACIHCQKSQIAETHWNFICTSCDMKTSVEDRYKLGLLLDDTTGTIPAFIFGNQAAKILPFTATELQQMHQKGIDVHDKIAEALIGKKLYCFVRSYDDPATHNKERRHSISVIYTEEEVAKIRGKTRGNLDQTMLQSGEDTTGADKTTEPRFEKTTTNDIDKPTEESPSKKLKQQ